MHENERMIAEQRRSQVQLTTIAPLQAPSTSCTSSTSVIAHLPVSQTRTPLPKAPPRRRQSIPTPSNTSAANTQEPVFSHPAEPLRTTIVGRRKVLQLCGGDDARANTIVDLMAKADLDCANFDPANGQLRDLVDSYAYGQLVRDAEAGDYLTAIATPDCSTFPSRRGPGCPPPLRGMTGADRYGFEANTPANSENVDY